MAQGITFSGLGSGLDTDSIIQQLTDIERRPIVLIQNRQIRLERQKSLVQQINSGLLSLRDSAENLADENLFSIVKVSSSDSQRVSVSATNDAAAGSFTVEVAELAQARSLSSRSFTSTSEALGLSGALVIGSKGIEVDGASTLQDVRDAINDADAGVNAQILTVASGDNRLIVTADKVGSQGFDLKDASSTDLVQALGFTSSDTSIKTTFASGARSAQFLEADQAIGTLLNLNSPPIGSVTVGDKQVAIDLASDSLDDIRDSINAAAPTGVTASVVSVDEGGLTRHHLEIDGTTSIVDNSGVLETMGVLDSGGAIQDEIVSGADGDAFTSTSTAVGSLLGLGTAPNGSVTIAGQTVALDLSTDSLTDVLTKINDAAIPGVTASVTTGTDEDGNSQFRLRIDGTTDLVDDGNVLETLGMIEGSNSAFESVARVVTANVANQQQGAVLNPIANGAKSAVVNSDGDPLGPLVGSSASGTVTIGDAQVAIDLNTDSLNDIRDAINAAAPTGVTATVNIVGASDFELQIDGTTDFDDPGGVLQGMGVLGPATNLTASTIFSDIVGANVTAGDSISISGTNRDGDQVAGTFNISSGGLEVSELLGYESLFGAVTASVDSSGRIAIADDVAGASSLSLNLVANNEGADSSLNLGTPAVTTEGTDARSAELQAGEDALIRINGIALSRSTNTITDAIEGVTLLSSRRRGGGVHRDLGHEG